MIALALFFGCLPLGLLVAALRTVPGRTRAPLRPTLNMQAGEMRAS